MGKNKNRAPKGLCWITGRHCKRRLCFFGHGFSLYLHAPLGSPEFAADYAAAPALRRRAQDPWFNHGDGHQLKRNGAAAEGESHAIRPPHAGGALVRGTCHRACFRAADLRQIATIGREVAERNDNLAGKAASRRQYASYYGRPIRAPMRSLQSRSPSSFRPTATISRFRSRKMKVGRPTHRQT